MALQIPQNVTVEQIEEQEKNLAIMKASIALKELQTKGLTEFKQAVSKVSSIEDAYKLASNFKWQRDKIHRVLNPPKEGEEKRGRPPAKKTK